jgi:hypothetical protein
MAIGKRRAARDEGSGHRSRRRVFRGLALSPVNVIGAKTRACYVGETCGCSRRETSRRTPASRRVAQTSIPCFFISRHIVVRLT